MVHIVYCDPKEKEIDKIITNHKTMVIRGAAGRKIPHSRVFTGERLYFMERGTKTITLSAIVKDVLNYIKLDDQQINALIDQNQDKLNLTQNQKQRWHKKCLCLVGFEKVEVIEPLRFEHQKNMDDWLIIQKIEDVLVGTSIPYNYEKSKF